MYIEKIHGPQDVKRLTVGEMETLAAEIRKALLEKLSAHGGHIGPNLGMVEATVALHYVFDSPHDRIVFDVSHQSYAHKMLTGRAEALRRGVGLHESGRERARLLHDRPYLHVGEPGLRTGQGA